MKIAKEARKLASYLRRQGHTNKDLPRMAKSMTLSYIKCRGFRNKSSLPKTFLLYLLKGK